MRNLLTGLDVGTSKVCAIVGESLPDGQLATLGFGISPCTGLRKGVVVNMSSLAGVGGAPLFGSYAASKAAVIQLTRVAAVELRQAGIRVNAVCPGFVSTAMVDRSVKVASGFP